MTYTLCFLPEVEDDAISGNESRHADRFAMCELFVVLSRNASNNSHD
jgi:hypothetical protein